MADNDHVALLKQGMEAWNKWREENPGIKPDLGGANLTEADLREARLSETVFGNTNLSDVKGLDTGATHETGRQAVRSH
jgi:uncharacterized protein YjbI with pentapeptide repeats